MNDEMREEYWQLLKDLQKIKHALSDRIFELASCYPDNEVVQDLVYAKDALLDIMANRFGVTYKEIFG